MTSSLAPARPPRSPRLVRRLAPGFITSLLLASILPAQILTLDAGVRSPELPSLRALLAYRHYSRVDEASLRAEAVYSPSRELELGADVPLIARRIEFAGSGDEDLFGFGDASLRAKFAIVRADDVMASDRVSLLGRAILPTGESDATAGGQPLDPRLQLGLGSFGFGVGAAGTLVRDRHRATLAFEWQHRGTHDGFEPGDQLELGGAWWYRVSPARFRPDVPEPEWRFVVEARSRYAFRDHGPGAAVSDEGFELDGIVGLQVNTERSLRAELGAIVPLIDELDDPFGRAGFGALFSLTFYF